MNDLKAIRDALAILRTALARCKDPEARGHLRRAILKLELRETIAMMQPQAAFWWQREEVING